VRGARRGGGRGRDPAVGERSVTVEDEQRLVQRARVPALEQGGAAVIDPGVTDPGLAVPRDTAHEGDVGAEPSELAMERETPLQTGSIALPPQSCGHANGELLLGSPQVGPRTGDEPDEARQWQPPRRDRQEEPQREQAEDHSRAAHDAQSSLRSSGCSASTVASTRPNDRG